MPPCVVWTVTCQALLFDLAREVIAQRVAARRQRRVHSGRRWAAPATPRARRLVRPSATRRAPLSRPRPRSRPRPPLLLRRRPAHQRLPLRCDWSPRLLLPRWQRLPLRRLLRPPVAARRSAVPLPTWRHERLASAVLSTWCHERLASAVRRVARWRKLLRGGACGAGGHSGPSSSLVVTGSWFTGEKEYHRTTWLLRTSWLARGCVCGRACMYNVCVCLCA